MSLHIAIESIVARIEKQSQAIGTEEASKTALVMPFIQALGYDVFDPSEVIPEFTADVGIKKGEKIDYALAKDGVVSVLIECKPMSDALDLKHASQLFRYFSTVDARFAILTNGVEYHFYSDLDKSNKMDERPFFIFNMLDHDEAHVKELSRFQKDGFDTDRILSTATNLKYLRLAKTIIQKEFSHPGEELIRLVAKQIHDGPLRTNVLDKFTEITKRAIDEVIKDRLQARIKTAFENDNVAEEELEPDTSTSDIVTTEEEIAGYNIIRAIGSEIVPPNRIVIRDAKSYCAILLDDNNRKPICRLHFNSSNKRISLFSEKNEEIVSINDLPDIFQHKERIKGAIEDYL